MVGTAHPQTKLAPIHTLRIAFDPFNGSSSLAAPVRRFAWIAVVLIAALYVASISRLTSFPMRDYANHVARAAVMADLLFHHGARFGHFFSLDLRPATYLLPDLLLTSAVELFGPPLGAGLFTGLVLLSLPCALLLYARATEVVPPARWFIFLIGLYLSTDWFFQMGFMAFRLAVALIVVNLALAEMLRRRWSYGVWVAHIGVIMLGFLAHLTAPAFVGVALAASGLVRLWYGTTTVRREAALLAPVVLLLAWYFGTSGALHRIGMPLDYQWAGSGGGLALVRKIGGLRREFRDCNWQLSVPVLILFAACLLWPVRRALRVRGLREPDVVERLLVAAAFLAVYFALPSEYRDGMYVDVRALPLVTLMLVFAFLRLPGQDAGAAAFGSAPMLLLAGALTAVNLVYVSIPLASENVWIERYRAVLTPIPSGAYVLPVRTDTNPPHGLHVASHVVMDRGAVTPYLFSDTNHDPMIYFRYKQQPYAPDNQWYRTQLYVGREALRGKVDWHRVECAYDYLLVTMPYDARLIRIPTVTVRSNEAAALLAVDKTACQSALRTAH